MLRSELRICSPNLRPFDELFASLPIHLCLKFLLLVDSQANHNILEAGLTLPVVK